MPLPDYYAVLGVPAGAEPEYIKHAYYRLARLYHPDVNLQMEDDTAIKRLNEAYTVLSDPVRRVNYDIQLLEERKRTIVATLLTQQRRRPRRMTWSEGAQGFVREFRRGIRGQS
jgi:DnaJ-class molecular chaperone with C-terminal Zn finger domain